MDELDENTPKTKRRIKNSESGQKPMQHIKKPQTHSIQSIDYFFLDETPTKYIGPIPNISKNCKHTLLIEIISYASTSPRPILSSEIYDSITYDISSKGSEFNLLSTLLSQYSKTLIKGVKTYNHFLLSKLPSNSNTLGFLSNSLNYNKIRLLFLSECQNQLEKICVEGWKNVILSPRSLVLTSSLLNSEKFVCMSNAMQVLVVLVERANLIKIHRGVYSVNDFNIIVPIYLLEYTLTKL